MDLFQAWPKWVLWHPLIVHFPLALLLVGPWLALPALVKPREVARPFLLCAFAVVLLGAAGAIVARESGEAAAAVAMLSGDAEAVLHQHKELGESVGWVAGGLAAGFAALLFLPPLARWSAPLGRQRLVVAVLLVTALVLAGLVTATGKLGGRMVHELGVMIDPNAAEKPER